MVFIIKTGMLAIAAGAWWNVQPAAGEQWLITEIHGGNTNFFFYDGTNKSPISGAQGRTFKAFVDNTIYFSMQNNDGTTNRVGYTGVFL